MLFICLLQFSMLGCGCRLPSSVSQSTRQSGSSNQPPIISPVSRPSRPHVLTDPTSSKHHRCSEPHASNKTRFPTLESEQSFKLDWRSVQHCPLEAPLQQCCKRGTARVPRACSVTIVRLELTLLLLDNAFELSYLQSELIEHGLYVVDGHCRGRRL